MRRPLWVLLGVAITVGALAGGFALRSRLQTLTSDSSSPIPGKSTDATRVVVSPAIIEDIPFEWPDILRPRFQAAIENAERLAPDRWQHQPLTRFDIPILRGADRATTYEANWFLLREGVPQPAVAPANDIAPLAPRGLTIATGNDRSAGMFGQVSIHAWNRANSDWVVEYRSHARVYTNGLGDSWHVHFQSPASGERPFRQLRFPLMEFQAIRHFSHSRFETYSVSLFPPTFSTSTYDPSGRARLLSRLRRSGPEFAEAMYEILGDWEAWARLSAANGTLRIEVIDKSKISAGSPPRFESLSTESVLSDSQRVELLGALLEKIEQVRQLVNEESDSMSAALRDGFPIDQLLLTMQEVDEDTLKAAMPPENPADDPPRRPE